MYTQQDHRMVYDIRFDEIFDNISMNKLGQYVITKCDLYDLVIEYVIGENYKDIKKYVSNFCVFKAISLYEDKYGDFPMKLDNKYEMYISLAHAIIMDIIEQGEMTEDKDEDDTDDEEETDDETDP